MTTYFLSAENTFYQEVAGELLVISLRKESSYYFSLETEALLDYFSEAPRSLESLFQFFAIGREEEKSFLATFIDDLVNKSILSKSDQPGPDDRPAGMGEVPYLRPAFHRESRHPLTELAFTMWTAVS